MEENKDCAIVTRSIGGLVVWRIFAKYISGSVQTRRRKAGSQINDLARS